MNDDEKRKLAELCGLKCETTNGVVHIWIYNTDVADWVAWNPFTNIEQAMTVAEKVFGWFEFVRTRPVAVWEYRCDGAFSSSHGTIIKRGNGTSLSEAICRAALNVLEE